MAEMKTERQFIIDYLSKNEFVIPIYQRPYAWGLNECEQLWSDIVEFFRPKNEKNEDDENDEDKQYFLGSIVMYQQNKKQHIIDGQQRTTTLMLLLKAAYDKTLQNAGNDKQLIGLRKNLEKCLWDIDFETDEANKQKCRLISEVATDKDKEILEQILQDTYTLPDDIDKAIKDSKSAYERNYLYFVSKTQDSDITMHWSKFCQTLLKQCIVLPIECDGADDEKKLENALRIFNTLNNRGMPLSDSDIFKSIIFKTKKTKDEQNAFGEKWIKIESSLKENDDNNINMDFIFRNYMHLVRARQKDNSDEIGLRRFFTNKSKKYQDILQQDATMNEIEELSKFWNDEYDDKYSKKSLQFYEVLEHIPNDYWKYLDSVYFMYCRDKGLDYFKNHEQFLAKLIANSLVKLINKQSLFEVRPIVFNAYASLYEKGELDFKTNTKEILENEILFREQFVKASSLIKSLLTLYLHLEYPEQEVGIIQGSHIEHIFPQKFRAEYKGWDKDEAKPFIESIGNKMWLEEKINIQASNDYFDNKKERYAKSKFLEAQELAKYPKSDWLKEDIEKRRDRIYERLLAFFKENINK